VPVLAQQLIDASHDGDLAFMAFAFMCFVFVGLLFWGWVWNVWGMLLAVPMMVVLKTVCDHVEEFKPVGELLGQ